MPSAPSDDDRLALALRFYLEHAPRTRFDAVERAEYQRLQTVYEARAKRERERAERTHGS